jgi:hypothetical protein
MKTSSAIRVNDFLQRAVSQGQGDTVQAVFGSVLNADFQDPQRGQDQVAIAITDIRAEIWGARSKLEAAGIAAALWERPIQQVLKLTEPLSVSATWGTHRTNYLQAEILTAWNWIAEIVAAEDDEITAKDLRELEQLLDELDRAAMAEGLPGELCAFILRQAASIRLALSRYQIKGVGPLKEALRLGLGELVCDGQILKQPAADHPARASALGTLGKLWKKTAEVTKDIVAVGTFYKLIAPTFPAIKQLASDAFVGAATVIQAANQLRQLDP